MGLVGHWDRWNMVRTGGTEGDRWEGHGDRWDTGDTWGQVGLRETGRTKAQVIPWAQVRPGAARAQVGHRGQVRQGWGDQHSWDQFGGAEESGGDRWDMRGQVTPVWGGPVGPV